MSKRVNWFDVLLALFGLQRLKIKERPEYDTVTYSVTYTIREAK